VEALVDAVALESKGGFLALAEGLVDEGVYRPRDNLLLLLFFIILFYHLILLLLTLIVFILCIK
jgi:hypothetical protein